MSSALARPWCLAGLEVPNRIVMAPMSTHRADACGRVTRSLIRYLTRRARGGCGMILVESATVDAARGSAGRDLRLDREASLEGFRGLTRELQDSGSRVAAQIWHAGPRARVAEGLPVSASGSAPGLPVSGSLGTSEIGGIVQRFVAAGDRAARAGADAVEVHAAHGYLLHHFVDPVVNRRRDAYGGTVEGRFRILAEIRRGLKARHPDLPAILRLSLRPDEDFPAVARAVENAGFDALDVRTGFSSMARETGGDPMPPGYTLHLARRIRPHLAIPLISGGRILTPEQATRAMSQAGLDAVVLGRALLADPDWAVKALAQRDIFACLYDCDPSCYSRFKQGEPLRCVFHGRQE